MAVTGHTVSHALQPTHFSLMKNAMGACPLPLPLGGSLAFGGGLPMVLGAQVSTAGGLSSCVGRAQALDAECIQIFLCAPQRWQAPRHSDEEVERFRAGVL